MRLATPTPSNALTSALIQPARRENLEDVVRVGAAVEVHVAFGPRGRGAGVQLPGGQNVEDVVGVHETVEVRVTIIRVADDDVGRGEAGGAFEIAAADRAVRRVAE